MRLSKAAEKILVLAVDRWHPVAKMAEAAGRPDLLEAAVAINGAASTASHVLHYGPIGVAEETPGDRSLYSLGLPDLAPWPMLRPWLRRRAEEQGCAVGYLLSRTHGEPVPSMEITEEIKALADRWEAFERAMSQFQRRMNMPGSERVRLEQRTIQGLLAMVGVEIGRALRADFLHRFAAVMSDDPEIITRVMHDCTEGTTTRYNLKIGDRDVALVIPSPLVTRMLDSLYTTSASVSPLQNNRLVRFAVGAKTLLTIGITATPEFAIKNAMRDMLSAFVLGRVWQAPWSMLRSAADDVCQNRVARDWVLQGGSFAAFYEHTSEYDVGKAEALLPGAAKGGRWILQRIWQAYTAPMRALEAGSRLSQYRRVLASGGTPRQAMMHARQVSTDFADRGASEPWWTYCRTVPFLNAALQGMNQLRKVFFTRSALGGRTRGPIDVLRHSQHARRSLARAVLLMAIPAGALWWNLSSEERREQYESQAAFEKASYVYLYDVNGSDYRVPVPFELGAGFMKVPELVLDRMLGLQTVDTDRAVDPIPLPTVRALVESTFLLSFIPALVQPSWHVLRNRDFLGRDIEPGFMRDWAPEDRFFRSTPGLARTIASGVPGVSALQTKVLLEGHLGHMARLLLHGTEELRWPVTKHGEKAYPEFWYRASGRRAFVREGPRRYTRHTIDLNQLDAEIRAATWRCEHVPSSCEANRSLMALRQALGQYAKFRRDLFDLVRTVETAPSMTRMEKEKRIDEAYRAVNEYTVELNQAIGKARKASE